MRSFSCLLLVVLLLVLQEPAYACSSMATGKQGHVVFPPKYLSRHPHQDYVYRLLQLALEVSEDKYGPCEADLLDQDLPLKRMERYLKSGQSIDVIALTVNRQRESQFLPVRFPIAKGLVGYRISVIRKGEQERFSSIKNKSDLAKLLAGQGDGWWDVYILEDNGMAVESISNIPSLPKMLAYGRFDYYPRGVLQLVPERETYEAMPLEIEKSILLRYPSITAFYVNKKNEALAERIEYGLEKALSSGQFNDYFYSHPTIVEALEQANLEKRTFIQLCNAYLPSWVPTNQDKYWLYPWPVELQSSDCKTRMLK
jgi:hypothetical protein